MEIKLTENAKFSGVIFLHLNSLSLRRQTFENCPHYSENSLPKKKLQLGENNESYPRILQSVPIILRHTLKGYEEFFSITKANLECLF